MKLSMGLCAVVILLCQQSTHAMDGKYSSSEFPPIHPLTEQSETKKAEDAPSEFEIGIEKAKEELQKKLPESDGQRTSSISQGSILEVYYGLLVQKLLEMKFGDRMCSCFDNHEGPCKIFSMLQAKTSNQ